MKAQTPSATAAMAAMAHATRCLALPFSRVCMARPSAKSPLRVAAVCEWQHTDALAGCGKYGIGDGWADGRDPGLSYAGRRKRRWDDMHLNFWHFVHA